MPTTLDDNVLHADFFEEAFQIGQLHDDPDASGERAGIGHNPVGRGCDVVPPRGGHGSHGCDDGLVLLIADAHDRIVDLLGRHDTAAGTVDAEHDRFDRRAVSELLQVADRLLRVQDHALHAYQRDPILSG